jgi:glycosyltransferase involved in cell wall biosynthesis
LYSLKNWLIATTSAVLVRSNQELGVLKSPHKEGTMHFLFISSFLGPIGGIETLIARMSNWLLNKGHRVTLLTTTVRESRELFREGIRITELGDQLTQLCFCHKAKRVWAGLRIERPDVIKAFDLTASWIASILSSGIRPPPKAMFGNYFPYLIPQSRNPLKYLTFRFFLLNLRQNFADDSILCMSEEQISEFRRHYGHHRNPNFWPLPVGDPSKSGPPRTPKWGRIVSIGRLRPMKEYNIYMIDVVARLRQKGYPVTWTVYGDGTLGDAMKARIDKLGLGEVIEMRGILNYSDFASALQDAYLFVGMGTSIIEAALCGVPGVVALAHETNGLTYGPLYRFRFGNCGELMDAAPSTTVEAEIERVLGLREQEYEEEMQRTREYAKAYAMDGSMDRFLEIVAKASAPKASYVLFYWYYIHSLIEWLRQKVKATG